MSLESVVPMIKLIVKLKIIYFYIQHGYFILIFFLVCSQLTLEIAKIYYAVLEERESHSNLAPLSRSFWCIQLGLMKWKVLNIVIKALNDKKSNILKGSPYLKEYKP